jgi:hypothetical protein
VVGALVWRRQRPRRRSKPSTNTTTTAMTSTHNKVLTAASLVGPGQFRQTLLPPTPDKQRGHGQTPSWGRGRRPKPRGQARVRPAGPGPAAWQGAALGDLVNRPPYRT